MAVANDNAAALPDTLSTGRASSALAVNATSTNVSFTDVGRAIACDARRLPAPLAARLGAVASVAAETLLSIAGVSSFATAAGLSSFAVSVTGASFSALVTLLTSVSDAVSSELDKFISTCSGGVAASETSAFASTASSTGACVTVSGCSISVDCSVSEGLSSAEVSLSVEGSFFAEGSSCAEGSFSTEGWLSSEDLSVVGSATGASTFSEATGAGSTSN